MTTQAQMLQEEKELEEKLFGTPESSETTDDKTPIPAKEEAKAPATEVPVETDTEQPKVETKEEEEREEDWKLRYTNLRSSRNQKLYDAQSALAVAESQIVTLQQKIQELMSAVPEVQEDVFKDAFTEEEREALGETAIAAMQKTAQMAADAKTEKINKELADARADAVKVAEANANVAAQAAYDTFLTKLASVVPDYTEVDLDPDFKAFMQTPDIDGMPRVSSFTAAEARGDAATVAKHMLDYKATKNPKEEAKASLEKKVGPTGNAAPAAPSTTAKESDELTWGEVNAHYTKHAQGGYRGKQSEYLAMEEKIDAAAISGKIRG